MNASKEVDKTMNLHLANRKGKDELNLLAEIGNLPTPTDLKMASIWWREYEAFRKQSSWSRTALFQDSGVFIFQKGLNLVEQLSQPRLLILLLAVS